MSPWRQLCRITQQLDLTHWPGEGADQVEWVLVDHWCELSLQLGGDALSMLIWLCLSCWQAGVSEICNGRMSMSSDARPGHAADEDNGLLTYP